MILPVVGERLEALLRLAAMEGAKAELRAGAIRTAISGLQDPAKAAIAANLAHELRRPAFLIVDSNKRAEEISETVRFFAGIFPGTGAVVVLPMFDTLPWESRGPHADILERRAAASYRLVAGQASLVIAPVTAALWRYREPSEYVGLTRVLEPDADVSLEGFVAHLGAVGYARSEMVELPGQFAVRGGIVDVFSPEAIRPVRMSSSETWSSPFENSIHARSVRLLRLFAR